MYVIFVITVQIRLITQLKVPNKSPGMLFGPNIWGLQYQSKFAFTK